MVGAVVNGTATFSSRGRSRNLKGGGGGQRNFLQKGGGWVQPLISSQKGGRGGGVRTPWTPPWICPCSLHTDHLPYG